MKLSKLEIWNFRSIEYVQIDIENLRLFVVSSGIDDIAYW
jgi:predicted ATPase